MAGLCDGNTIVDLHGAVIHDVVVGISAAVRIVISVFLATGIRASVKHHHAAGLILDCRLAVGHIVHGAVAGDGQRAVVGDGMAAYIGQSSAVQIQGQFRILGDYNILFGVFQQRHRVAVPGGGNGGREGSIILATHGSGGILLSKGRNHPVISTLFHITGRIQIFAHVAGEGAAIDDGITGFFRTFQRRDSFRSFKGPAINNRGCLCIDATVTASIVVSNQNCGNLSFRFKGTAVNYGLYFSNLACCI